MGDEGIKALSEVIDDETGPQCNLKKLGVRCCELSDKGAVMLIGLLQNLSSFHHLSLAGNDLNSCSFWGLMPIFKMGLLSLDLANCNLGDHGMLKISTHLEKCRLNKLHLTQNNISAKGANTLSTALKSEYCHIKHLKINKNPLKDEGLFKILVALGE